MQELKTGQRRKETEGYETWIRDDVGCGATLDVLSYPGREIVLEQVRTA